MTTRGVDTPTAEILNGVRARHAPAGCPGGQHYMARGPGGPDDRPWKCRTCGHEQSWGGGYAAWLANHQSVVLAATQAGDAP